MKKVLIFFPERKLTSKGGPAGYLYNLNSGLKALSPEKVEVLFNQDAPIEVEENERLRKWIPNRIKELRRAIKFSQYLKKKTTVDDSVLDYDAIHFHKTEDMYWCREFLEKYKGIVVLTSHTPCAPHQELIGRLNPKDYQMLKDKLDRLVEMERYAFDRADKIIFPCKEAEEPYYRTWNDYQNVRKNDKYKYMPTGINKCFAQIGKDEIRKKYNIPTDAFVISYVGRHNEIKGYSDLKVLGAEILKENKDIYFLIAGKEEPIHGLQDDHWIEVGWTDDPHSLIAASDLFVLPNRETYFDLVLLETLSLGVPVLMSLTGGNKYFTKYNENGLMFYSDLHSAKEWISKWYRTDIANRLLAGRSLINLFDKHFTVNKFAERYIKTMEEVLEE